MSLDYGYIFSQIDKTKKKKRKRWTQADTDAAAKKLAEEKEARGPVVSQRMYKRPKDRKADEKPGTYREGTGGSLKKEPPVPKGGLATNRKRGAQAAHSSGSGTERVAGRGGKTDGRKLSEEEKKRREFTGQKRGTKREVKISDLKEGGTGELSDQAKLNRKKVRDAEMERLRRSVRDSEAKRKLERKIMQPKVSDLERLDAEAENRARDHKAAWHASRSGKKPGIGSGFWTPEKEDKKKKKRKRKRTAEEEKLLSDDWLEGTEQETTEEERAAEGQQGEDDDIGPIGKSLWKSWLKNKEDGDKQGDKHDEGKPDVEPEEEASEAEKVGEQIVGGGALQDGLHLIGLSWKSWLENKEEIPRPGDERGKPEWMKGDETKHHKFLRTANEKQREDKQRERDGNPTVGEQEDEEMRLISARKLKKPHPKHTWKPKDTAWKSWLEKKVEGTKTDSSQYDETDSGFRNVDVGPTKPKKTEQAIAGQVKQTLRDRKERQEAHYKEGFRKNPKGDPPYPKVKPGETMSQYNQRQEQRDDDTKEERYNTTVDALRDIKDRNEKIMEKRRQRAKPAAKPKQGTKPPKGTSSSYAPQGTKKPGSATKKPASTSKPKAKPKPNIDGNKWLDEQAKKKKPVISKKPPFADVEREAKESELKRMTEEAKETKTTSTKLTPEEIASATKKDKPADNDDDWENPMASQKSLYKSWLKQVTKPYDAKGKEIPPAKGREDWKARPPNMSVDEEESFMEYMEALPHEKIGTKHRAPPGKQSHFDKWLASKPKEYHRIWEESHYDPEYSKTLKVSDAKAGTLLDEDRAVQSGKVRPPTPKHLVRPSDKAEEGPGGMLMGAQRGLGHEAGYKQDPGQTAQITEVKDEKEKSAYENHEQDEGAEVEPNKQQIPISKPGMDVAKSLYKKALITKYNNIYKPANI